MENSYSRKSGDLCRTLTFSITPETTDQLETVKKHVRNEGMEFNLSAFIRAAIQRETSRFLSDRKAA
jgi:hypothetical protein